jgi:hypothetical protein
VSGWATSRGAELRLPGQFVHRATVGRLTRMDSGREGQDQLWRRAAQPCGIARSDVTACSRSVTMPIHPNDRQHPRRIGNTCGVSANSLDNTCSAESYHEQRISPAARIRHHQGA